MRTRIVVTQTKATRRPSTSLARSSSAPVAGAAAAPLSFLHHPQRPVAAAAAAPVSSAPPEQDVSTSIDTTGTRESGEASFGASDASFADFDALNDTMALLAEHEGGSGVPSVFANSARRSSNSGHISTRLEATAATYSPDFLDRVVDTLVGAPQFFAEMESSFAECDEKDLTMGDSYMYSNSHNVTTLDDTETTNFDADATQNESANSSTFVDDMNTTGMATVATPLTRTSTSANVARKASRFTKVVGARNVPCDADASANASAFYDDDDDTASGTPNAAARVLRRFSTSLSLSTKAKTTKRSDVEDIATNSTASRGREAEPEACELKSTRSYLVEAGDDVLIHEDTATTASFVSGTTTQQGISNEGFPTSASVESINLTSTSPQKSTCTAAPPITKAADQSPAAGTTPPFSPELAALAPANQKNTLAGAIIVSHVEELLNEIYGPPRTEFGEQSSLVRAQLIVDKYRTRPKDLIRVLEKKAAAKKAAEAEASASKNVSDLGATNKNIPSAKFEKAKLDGATNQAPFIQLPQAKSNTAGSASLSRRLRSFGRSASTKLRTRSRSVDRFRRLRSNTFDDSENYSTPEKARGKDLVHTSTPDTVDNDYSDENDCSFSPLSHIGLHRAEI